MAMAVGGKKGGAIAAIHVTPMADIMIVLLIIFMVITPMLQKGVDVKLPPAGKLKERLEDLPEGGKMIYLKADQELAYSEVMKVMDLARDAGVEEIALIAEPKTTT